ncbi:unnamed protein product [Thelazia callipaeda]|uniref:Riboflavin synthase subunit alpha n=1 Tax=Thelazia callipaeda TaxID=103827 RepID=A0A0N5DAM0_THECL|nr:unnamed protein product [Thelazia callipaeda]
MTIIWKKQGVCASCLVVNVKNNAMFLFIPGHQFYFQVPKLGKNVNIGLDGFYSDAKTVFDKIVFRKNLYELKENRKIKPEVEVKDEFNDYKDVCNKVDAVFSQKTIRI